jgi:hypothetical protein
VTEEPKGMMGAVTKWTVKSGKISAKNKMFLSFRKMFLFYSSNEKSAPKGVFGVDLYSVERVSTTQVDLLPTSNAWSFSKGFVRTQVCLSFDNAGMADRWMDELSKKTEVGIVRKQFGIPLSYFEARGEVMPQVFLDCVRYIYNNCLQKPELFRQGGDGDDVKWLRSEYNYGNVPSLEKITDGHTVAALLKTWLTELPQPLLTYALFSEIMTAMKLSGQQQLQMIQKSIAKIPKINQRVLWITTQLLKLVHDQSAVNGMISANLSVIFAQKIVAPKNVANITYKTQPLFAQVTDLLILHGDVIFTTALHSTPPEWSYILDPNRGAVVRKLGEINGPLVSSIEQLPPGSLPASAAVPVAAAAAPASVPPPADIPAPPPSLAVAGSPAGVPAGIPPPPAAVSPGISPRGVPPPPPSAVSPRGSPRGPVPVPVPVPANLPPPPSVGSLPPPPLTSSLPGPVAGLGSPAPAPPPASLTHSAPGMDALPLPLPVGAPPSLASPRVMSSPQSSARAQSNAMAALQAENATLKKENERLKEGIARLRSELEEKNKIVASIFGK